MTVWGSPFLSPPLLEGMEVQQQIESRIKMLSAERFKDREQAARDLQAFGPKAVPALRRALLGEDEEILRRAKELLSRVKQ